MVIEFFGILVVVLSIAIGLVSRAHSCKPMPTPRLIALHLLSCVGLIAYSLVLDRHGRELHSLGKELGRSELMGELRKAGIDVPDEFKPSISKGRLAGPSVGLQLNSLVIFWPSVAIQSYIFLVLIKYRRSRIEGTASRDEMNGLINE